MLRSHLHNVLKSLFLRWLPLVVASVWLAWLALLGLMAVWTIRAIPHPHFLPVVLLLQAMIVAGLILFGSAGWLLVRGAGRGRAAASLLVGLAPLGFMTGHVMYGLRASQRRQIDLDMPLRLLVPFGESILDLAARIAYPERIEGEAVVMISTPIERAREQVEAMDRHVKQISARLGRTPQGRIHWVRGPLLGIQGKASFGICMGSRPGEQATDADGLTPLDRHEIAHCVLSPICSLTSEPPAFRLTLPARGPRTRLRDSPAPRSRPG